MKSTAKSIHSVSFQGQEIPFELTLSERKSFVIQVCPCGTIKVKSPARYGIQKVKDTLLKQAGWIKKKQEELQISFKVPTERNYASGEKFLYLGKEHTLQVHGSIIDKVELDGNTLHLHVTKFTYAYKKAVMEDWYCHRAAAVFQDVWFQCIERVSVIGVKFTGTVKLKFLKSQWGSCDVRGNIILNVFLIKVPRECIEYIMTHELCHLKEMNHSKCFYALMTKTMPDWQKRRKMLKRYYPL